MLHLRRVSDELNSHLVFQMNHKNVSREGTDRHSHEQDGLYRANKGERHKGRSMVPTRPPLYQSMCYGSERDKVALRRPLLTILSSTLQGTHGILTTRQPLFSN